MALGARVTATSTGAVLPSRGRVHPGESARSHESLAIGQLNREFMRLLEGGRFAAVAALFADDARVNLSSVVASGRQEIDALFTVGYAAQTASMIHSSYRQCALDPLDAVVVSQDGKTASAAFYVEVELVQPLTGESALVQMARLQGQLAVRRRERGRFEGTYLRRGEAWQLHSLDYIAT
jgi:hypothetical protein